MEKRDEIFIFRISNRCDPKTTEEIRGKLQKQLNDGLIVYDSSVTLEAVIIKDNIFTINEKPTYSLPTIPTIYECERKQRYPVFFFIGAAIAVLIIIGLQVLLQRL